MEREKIEPLVKDDECMKEWELFRHLVSAIVSYQPLSLKEVNSS